MAASSRRNQPGRPHGSTMPEAAPETAAGDEDEWLTVPEIMTALKIHRRTWQHWRTRKRTPKMHRLPNGEFRIHRDDYQAWLAGLEVTA
ncbi:helix-turn-helix transcriptional regulator [Nonomuraea lactucae]|uniref:helix-turn-helix transcriptional regulator n=1 Tax=Nonomuraea lactucae TaxID=2249762 RepID=UPI001965A46D|nr:helix-turn-helix domain-containing protein [Nonomuraea lactucae]